MKKIIYIIFSIAWGCQSTTELAPLDIQLQKATKEAQKSILKRNESHFFQFNEAVQMRGRKPDEENWLKKMFSYQQHYYQLIHAIDNGTYNFALYKSYRTQIDSLKSSFTKNYLLQKNENFIHPKQDSLAKVLSVNKTGITTSIFKNYLLENNVKISHIAKRSVGTSCFRFDPLPYIHLNAKTYHQGDTIFGKHIIPLNSYPLFPTLKINNHIINVNKYEYTQIIDSSFAPINIEVNYFKKSYRDTSFHVKVEYGKN